MGTSLRKKMAQISPERQKRINDEAKKLHAEYLTLQELRKAKALTQVQLAETLGIRQASIAQMEKRTDLMISTVRSYVEAMGGKLKLSVEFPDHVAVSLDGLGDTDEPSPGKAPGRRAG
ncbi:Antitoxin HigA [hydrothermal vent metagenome]|uniref:Antitoxin HigA n=1 Tax=hydrothermal vent metagenome TaxID=652676 RepID=A0A3B0TR09_9ZZZZ